MMRWAWDRFGPIGLIGPVRWLLMEGSLVRKTSIFYISEIWNLGLQQILLDAFERFGFAILEIGQVYEHVVFCRF